MIELSYSNKTVEAAQGLSTRDRFRSVEPYAGSSTSAAFDGIANYQIGPSPGQRRMGNHATLGEQVYEALKNAKVETALRASHISSDERVRLFRQLESLHEIEEWETGDAPLILESFLTFIRFIIFASPKKWPGLGLTKKGILVASWRNAADRLVIEFLPSDEIQWILSMNRDGRLAKNAGRDETRAAVGLLVGYASEHWWNPEARGADAGKAQEA